MDRSKKYKILTEDKKGITSEILNVINDYDINLQIVEVCSKEVLIKVNSSDEKFLEDIRKIDGVIDIKNIKFMNSEKMKKIFFCSLIQLMKEFYPLIQKV